MVITALNHGASKMAIYNYTKSIHCIVQVTAVIRLIVDRVRVPEPAEAAGRRPAMTADGKLATDGRGCTESRLMILRCPEMPPCIRTHFAAFLASRGALPVHYGLLLDVTCTQNHRMLISWCARFPIIPSMPPFPTFFVPFCSVFRPCRGN